MEILGIDIGGSGIKGATVDLKTGELTRKRFRIKTPRNPKPAKVARIVQEIVHHFEWSGRLGIGFPGVIRHGQIFTAANLHKSWEGIDGEALFAAATGCEVKLINDADAAGLAEMRFGAGKDRMGKVMLFTLGTGIGSAMFLEGKLVSNTELGHLEWHGDSAEVYAAESARIREKLSWKKWGKRVSGYLQMIEFLFSPDLIILGGGAVKNFEKFSSVIEVNAEVVTATSGNLAGIMGVALAAAE